MPTLPFDPPLQPISAQRLPPVSPRATPHGLLTTVQLQEQLERALAHASRTGEKIALHTIHVLIPEDRVRRGPIGDDTDFSSDAMLFIRRVGEHAAAVVRSNDVLATAGPRTLYLLQRGLTHSQGVRRLAEVIRDRIGGYLDASHLGEARITIGAVVAEPGASSISLLRSSVLVANEAPSDTIALAGDGVDGAEGEIVLEIQHALRHDGFFLEFQPQVDLRTGELRAAEALVRLESPERGVINPTDFIAIAEDHGLMSRLGDWVMREALAQWNDTLSRRELLLAVNVSGLQLKNRQFAQEVLDALDQSVLPARRLELEITEGIDWEQDAVAANNLRQLRGEGVRVAFDDFGEGFSTLARLGRNSCDRIKIPRGLVLGIGSSRRTETILEALLRLARDLGIATTAEGIETEPQRQWLSDRWCQLGQGLLFGAPGPVAALPVVP